MSAVKLSGLLNASSESQALEQFVIHAPLQVMTKDETIKSTERTLSLGTLCAQETQKKIPAVLWDHSSQQDNMGPVGVPTADLSRSSGMAMPDSALTARDQQSKNNLQCTQARHPAAQLDMPSRKSAMSWQCCRLKVCFRLWAVCMHAVISTSAVHSI